MHKTTERLGTDPLAKLLFRLGTPSIISMLTISLYNLVDTFWVARLGHQAIAALTIVMPFFVLCVAIGVGTGVGVNALASRRFGERNVEAANQVAGQIVFLSMAFGLLVLLATNLFPRFILRVCGAPDDVLPFALPYLTILGWGMPFFFLQLIGRNVFQASGDAIRPMWFTIVGQVCNAILDPFFIFGWGFFPEMGIGGAAMATVIANILGTLLGLYWVLSNKTAYRLKLSHLTPKPAVVVDIYRVGMPAMLMDMTESIVFVLFNHTVAAFGSIALAAVGIAGRISDLAFMPIIGTAHGLLPIVGFSFGAKLWSRLWEAVRLACLWLVGLLAVATIGLEVFTPQVIALFNKDPALLEIAVPGMRIFLSTLVLVGPAVVFITAFQGLSKGRDAMVLSLARQFIFFVPALFLLPRLMGLTGVWVALPVSDILGTITAGLWLWREYRMQKKSGLWTGELPVKKTKE